MVPRVRLNVLWMQSFFVEGDDDMQLVLAQVSDAEALQRYEDVCKDAEETDVLPFRLQYADMSAFLKAQTDWHIGANLPEGVVSSSLYVVRQHGEVVATLVLHGMSSMHI